MNHKIKENESYDWAAHGYADDGSNQEWDEETQKDWDEKMSMPLGIEIKKRNNLTARKKAVLHLITKHYAAMHGAFLFPPPQHPMPPPTQTRGAPRQIAEVRLNYIVSCLSIFVNRHKKRGHPPPT